MPSPVGHSLLGLAVGMGFCLRHGPWRKVARQLYEHRGFLLLVLVLLLLLIILLLLLLLLLLHLLQRQLEVVFCISIIRVDAECIFISFSTLLKLLLTKKGVADVIPRLRSERLISRFQSLPVSFERPLELLGLIQRIALIEPYDRRVGILSERLQIPLVCFTLSWPGLGQGG